MEYYTKSEGLGFLIQNLESTSVLNSGVCISGTAILVWIQSVNQSLNHRFQIEVVKLDQTWSRSELDHLMKFMKSSCTISLDLTNWYESYRMILEWVAMTQQAFPPSEFGHGICGSIKIESVWSSGRTVRPSVRPFQWLARVELESCIQRVFRIDQFWTVRPRTISGTDSKRRPGSNSSETSTRSRKLSASLVVKHEALQTWWPTSKKESWRLPRRLPFHPKII